jgi:hypothetical protein
MPLLASMLALSGCAGQATKSHSHSHGHSHADESAAPKTESAAPKAESAAPADSHDHEDMRKSK